MARNIDKLAAGLGATRIVKVPETGGGAFGAAHLAMIVQSLQTAALGQPEPAPPLTRAEFDQRLLELGVMSELPDTAADFDDPNDKPIAIEGEPLSETIIRERR